MLDYESSFTYSECKIPGNADFYAGPGGDVAEEVEFKSKAKFKKRLMVWLAISPSGIFKPIFSLAWRQWTVCSTGKKIIRRKFIPFLVDKYQDKRHVFCQISLQHNQISQISSMPVQHSYFLVEGEILIFEEAGQPAQRRSNRAIEDMWGIIKQY